MPAGSRAEEDMDIVGPMPDEDEDDDDKANTKMEYVETILCVICS